MLSKRKRKKLNVPGRRENIKIHVKARRSLLAMGQPLLLRKVFWNLMTTLFRLKGRPVVDTDEDRSECAPGKGEMATPENAVFHLDQVFKLLQDAKSN